MTSKSVRIEDVAKHAGVSRGTVSRVITGRGYVKEQTRDAVLKSIKALDYRPNVSARALAGRKSYRLGFLYANPSSFYQSELSAFYISELMIGALSAISERGHQLLVHEVIASADSSKQKFELDPVPEAADLKSIIGKYDGVIVPPPLCDAPHVRDFLLKNDVPAVLLSGDEGKGRAKKICIDDFAAGREVTNHLIGLGHKRIAIIKGHPNIFASAQRYDGYRAALEDAGIPFEDRLAVQGEYTFRSGFDAAKELLTMDDRPTAIFASNDDMAAGVLAVAGTRGISVPGQLSIVGFDDSPIASSLYPRLTTVRQPLDEMSKQVVESLLLLVSQTEDQNEEASTVFPYKFIPGNSTAPFSA